MASFDAVHPAVLVQATRSAKCSEVQTLFMGLEINQKFGLIFLLDNFS